MKNQFLKNPFIRGTILLGTTMCLAYSLNSCSEEIYQKEDNSTDI